jgi:hypothetical protein
MSAALTVQISNSVNTAPSHGFGSSSCNCISSFRNTYKQWVNYWSRVRIPQLTCNDKRFLKSNFECSLWLMVMFDSGLWALDSKGNGSWPITLYLTHTLHFFFPVSGHNLSPTDPLLITPGRYFTLRVERTHWLIPEDFISLLAVISRLSNNAFKMGRSMASGL